VWHAAPRRNSPVGTGERQPKVTPPQRHATLGALLKEDENSFFMVQFVLIRPGSTDYDEQGRIQGTLDIPVNAQGSSEIDQIVPQLQELGIENLYSSPCLPAKQTAQRIGAALSLKVKDLPHMQNIDHGLWQGMLIEEVRLKQPKVYRQWQEQPECIRPPQGETVAEAYERVQSSMGRLLKKHKHGCVGLVVPEPLATLVRCYLGRGELANLWCNSHGDDWEVIDVQTPVASR
jgi:broad specificity phosphatase PhoE